MSRRSRARREKKNPARAVKHKTASSPASAAKTGFTDRDLKIFSALLVFLVAWIAYANALHNVLIFDDVTFSPGNRSWELSVSSVKEYFTSDAWANVGKETGLYRPVFLLSVVVETKLFGEWLMGYHLVNVLFHSLVALSLFGLIRYLLLATDSVPKLANYAALMAALLFAVHPIHTEVVNSIFNRSGMLVALGIVAGLWWFLPRVEKSPFMAWTGINLIFLWILFCKETAVVFPAILTLTLLVALHGDWRYRIRQVLPVISMLVPMAIFFTMRSIALSADQAVGSLEQALVEATPDQIDESLLSKIELGFDPRKLVATSTVSFDALTKMIWPNPLLAFYPPSSTNFWLSLAAHAGLLALGVFAYLRKYPLPLLGLLIYYVALLPSSRLFSASAGGFVFAERYMYLPAVGLAISVAFLLYWLVKTYKPRGIGVAVLVLMIAMAPLTWARNAEWVSNIKLTESDYAKGNTGGKNLRVLISALLAAGENARARRLCDKHIEDFEKNWFVSATCGLIYKKANLDARAERAYLAVLKNRTGRASGHYALAELYLHQGRLNEAKEQFELSIEAEQKDFVKNVLAAEMLTKLYPNDREKLLEARAHLEAVIAEYPQFQHARNELAEVNRMLRATSRQQN